MASIKIINTVKYSKVLYGLYCLVGNVFVEILKLFLKPDPKLVVFVTGGGKLMSDSPRSIYDMMCQDARFDDYKLIWAFRDVSKFSVPRGEKIQLDSFAYYRAVLKARVWVTNVSMTRGLSFTGINTFSLNSWHGTAIKMIGADVLDKSDAFTTKKKGKDDTIFLAQGDHDVEVWQRAFNISPSRIVKTGLPRNDELVAWNNPDDIQRIKNKMGIPSDKKVILYAPTFRDYEKQDGKYLVLAPPVDFKKWESALGDDYILLFRAHPSVVKVMNISVDNTFVRDVSTYPTLNELMVVSDVMISDYSSIMFDYSILGRPIIPYTYDFDHYQQTRGMYFDIRKELYCAENEEDLITLIKNKNLQEIKDRTILFQKKFVQEYGNATNKALDLIYCAIQNDSYS